VNKEGFNVSLKQAKKVIEHVIEENNASIA
jgi:hypothetical protein